MAEYEGEPLPPHVPRFQDIYMEPQSLAHFAELVNGDRGALVNAWNAAKAEMESGPEPNFPGKYVREFHYANGYPELAYDGDGGIQEGKAFYRAYFLTVGAEVSLMEDMLLGLQTLAEAARMIHGDYANSDAANAAGVEGAFTAYERSSVLHALGVATDPTEGGTGDE